LSVAVSALDFDRFQAARFGGLRVDLAALNQKPQTTRRPIASTPIEAPRATPLAHAEPNPDLVWMRDSPREIRIFPPHIYTDQHPDPSHEGPWGKAPQSLSPQANNIQPIAVRPRVKMVEPPPGLYENVMALDGALSDAVWRLNDGLKDAYAGLFRVTASTLSYSAVQIQENGKAALSAAATKLDQGFTYSYTTAWQSAANGVTALTDRVINDQRSVVALGAAALMATTLSFAAANNTKETSSIASSTSFGAPAYASQSYTPPLVSSPLPDGAAATANNSASAVSPAPEIINRDVAFNPSALMQAVTQHEHPHLTKAEAHQVNLEEIADRVVTQVNAHNYLPVMELIAQRTGFSVQSQMAMIGSECAGHLDVEDNEESSAQGVGQILRYTFPDMIRAYWQQDRDLIAATSPHIVPIMDLMSQSLDVAQNDPAMHGQSQRAIDDHAAVIYKHKIHTLREQKLKQYHELMHDALKTKSPELKAQAVSMLPQIDGIQKYSTFKKASILARRDFAVSVLFISRDAVDGLNKANQLEMAAHYTQSKLTWLGHFLGHDGLGHLLAPHNINKNVGQILHEHAVFKGNHLRANVDVNTFVDAATERYTGLESIFNTQLAMSSRPAPQLLASLPGKSYH